MEGRLPLFLPPAADCWCRSLIHRLLACPVAIFFIKPPPNQGPSPQPRSSALSPAQTAPAGAPARASAEQYAAAQQRHVPGPGYQRRARATHHAHTTESTTRNNNNSNKRFHPRVPSCHHRRWTMGPGQGRDGVESRRRGVKSQRGCGRRRSRAAAAGATAGARSIGR